MAGFLTKYLKALNLYTKISVFSLIIIYSLLKHLEGLNQANPTINNLDSPSYFKFEFFPAFRMQILTAIYSAIADDQKIIEFQTVVSFVSWSYLLVAILIFFSYSWLSIFAAYLMTILATSLVIQEHNYILGSEALNNSGMVFFFGSLLIHYKRKTDLTFFTVFASLFIIAGTKSSSAITAAFVAIIFISFEYFSVGKFTKRKGAIAALSLIVVGFFAATALSSDITKTLTTSGTINNRLWVDEEWRKQILDSGYPVAAREVWIAYSEKNLGSPPDQAVVDLPEFQIWWEQGGSNFLNSFLLKNPNYAIVGSICLPCLNPDFNFGQTLIAGWSKGTSEYRTYASLNAVELSRTFYWPIKPEDSYSFIGFLFLVLFITSLIMSFSKTQQSRFYAQLFWIIISFVLMYSHLSWWFGSKPVDMTRHQLAGAISLRILAIISLLYILTWAITTGKASFQKIRNQIS